MPFRFLGAFNLPTNAGAVLQSLYSDLTGASLPAWLTAAGGANGTRINSAGTTAATSAPRFDYDASALTCRGLLVEEARTNGFATSNSFAVDAATTINSANATGIDGATTADKISAAGSISTQRSAKTTSTFAFVSGTVYTVTFCLKAGVASLVQMTMATAAQSGAGYVNFDLSAGTIVGSGGTGVTGSIERASNGFWACSITFTCTGASTTSPLVAFISSASSTRLAALSNAGATFFATAAQVEVGAFPTSRVFTTGTVLTRSADAINPVGAASTYLSGGGSYIVEQTSVQTGAKSRSYGASLSSLAANNRYSQIAIYDRALTAGEQSAKLTAGATLP